MICLNCQKPLKGQQRKFCSLKCKNVYHVRKYRRETKKRLVEMFGGGCQRCGYNRSVAALHFHHKDDNKEFGIGSKIIAWHRLVAEAEKCELICSNCHAELHSPVV